MSNPNLRSRVEGTEGIPLTPQGQNFHYVSEYDSYGYMPPPASFSHQLQQPNPSREGYHMNPTNISNFYISNANGPNITASRVKSESSRLVSSQVKNEQVVKGESRVSYVPYEKKVVEYENRTYVEKVPVKRKVITYEERKVVQTVPREVVKQDFYAVEKRIQYYKEVVPEKKIEMVPVQRKIKRYEYVPVQKQIVHYPENVDLQTAKGQSRVVLGSQGVAIKSDAEFRPINPALIYNYSARPESRYNPIGYVDQGQSRVFSNSPTFMAPIDHSEYFYGLQQQQQIFPRTNSAQKFETSRVFSPRLQPGPMPQQSESYIKELSNLGKTELKRPFQLLQQSNARSQNTSHPHLQRVNPQRDSQQYPSNKPENDTMSPPSRENFQIPQNDQS